MISEWLYPNKLNALDESDAQHPWTVRTELTCPCCNTYDTFASCQLNEIGSFLVIGAGHVYICAVCGWAVLPDDEFSSDEILEIRLHWNGIDDALPMLEKIDSHVCAKRKYTRLEHLMHQGMSKNALDSILTEIVTLDPATEKNIQILELDNRWELQCKRYVVFTAGDSAEHIMCVDASASVLRSDSKIISYTVRYTPISASLVDGAHNLQSSQSKEFLRNLQLASDPLFCLNPSDLKEFVRLTIAPSSFLTCMFEITKQLLAREAASDDPWKGL